MRTGMVRGQKEFIPFLGVCPASSFRGMQFQSDRISGPGCSGFKSTWSRDDSRNEYRDVLPQSVHHDIGKYQVYTVVRIGRNLFFLWLRGAAPESEKR